MNPRSFCYEKGYETVIVLTYSFDPLFFERVILQDLKMGGATSIVVIADQHQIEEVVPQVMGQVRHLGRSYYLCPTKTLGRQHAKLILKFSKQDALVWIGSNNLTSGGWAYNGELATIWKITPADEIGILTLHELLNLSKSLVSEEAKPIVEEVLELPWIKSINLEQKPNIKTLFSHEENNLASQLSKRWSNKNFDRVLVITGSTDEEGAFLSWACDRFGIKEAIVALDPDMSDFDPLKLEKLALGVNIVPLTKSKYPRTHAKFYWFEGKDGCCAVMGSANCSRAAWLLPPSRGGNIELIVVYDSCKKEDFSECLELFSNNEAKKPSEIAGLCKHKVKVKKLEHTDNEIRLLELNFSENSARLMAITSPVFDNLGKPEKVEAEFEGLFTPLQCNDAQGSLWIGSSPNLPNKIWPDTYFGRLVFDYPEGKKFTNFYWLNEEDQLQQLSKGQKLSNAIQNMSKPSVSGRDQQKMVEEVNQIAQLILSDTKRFPDQIVFVTSNNQTSLEVTNTRLIEPTDLVVKLADGQSSDPKTFGTSSSTLPYGVFQVFFSKETNNVENEKDFYEEDPYKDELSNIKGSKSTTEPSIEKPPERLRKQLRSYIENFLTKLNSQEFLAKCTATQLTQAIAFPLAVISRGIAGLWLDQETSAKWAIELVCMLFQVKISNSEHRGMLGFVKNRYFLEGRTEIFEHAVGDGTLWVAACAVLDCIDWKATFRGIDKVVLLSNLYKESILYSSVDVGKLRYLISRLNVENSNELLLQWKQTSELVLDIEKELTDLYNKLDRAPRNFKYLVGDPLWKPKVGFVRIKESTVINDPSTKIKIETPLELSLKEKDKKEKKDTIVSANFYLSLRYASEKSAILSKLLANLAPCWVGHDPQR